MTKVILLEQLKAFQTDAVKNLILPVAPQEDDVAPPLPRTADIYSTNLPDSTTAKEKVPYILNQVITSKDLQKAGQRTSGTTTVRSIFCVYNNNGQEGGLSLLTLMEQVRISLLEHPIIGNQFRLDLESGLEGMIYPENIAPYFAGEMISVWFMPPVTRLDTVPHLIGLPMRDPLLRTITTKGNDENVEENQ